MNRRTFLTTGSLGLAAGLAALPRRHVEPSIVGAELYLINVEAVRHFSTGTWYNRQHLMLHLRTGNHGGWSEIIASVNEPEVDLSEWRERAALVIGKTPREALDWLRAEMYGSWDSKPVEWLEFALYDLLGRQENTPAVRLLGLKDNQPVPGLFAILESDPARLLAKVEEAHAQQLTSHVKLKLFGDAENDRALIRTLREALGPEAFLIGDPNGGYKDGTLQQYADILTAHHAAGLNGCEDPAVLTNPEWVELQRLVGELALIPDKPLRPSWESIHTLLPGMGKIYNFHPKTTGSLADMVTLGRRIQGWGGQIMIGDDSLVGAGATAWQQIACGFGAICTEALEKPQESTGFLDCIEQQATYTDAAGRVHWEPAPGFGLHVDTKKLSKSATRVLTV